MSVKQLSKNFKASEFACNDANKTPVPRQYWKNLILLVKNLQTLRDHVGRPIVINSAYRTPEYNKAIGGASRSQHLTASAADIRIPGMLPMEVAALIEQLIADGKMTEGGLGIYDTFTHYDVRGSKARWDLRSNNA